MKNCPNCGTEISDNALFCNNCGTKIDQTNEAEAASSQAQPQLPSEEVKQEEAEAAPAAAPEAAPVAAAPAKKKSPVLPIVLCCSAAAVVLAAAGSSVYLLKFVPEKKYNEAAAAFEEGNYEAAASEFEAVGAYKNAKDRAAEANAAGHYANGKKAFDEGDYEKAKTEFEAAGNYDSAEYYAEQSELGIHYAKGVYLSSYGDKEKAVEELTLAESFKDAKQLAGKILIELGDKAAEAEDYAKAATYWSKAEFYDIVPDRDEPFIYGLGLKAMNEKDYKTAIGHFERIFEFKDAHMQECECYYQLAEQEYAAGNLEKAEEYYVKCEMRHEGSYYKHEEVCETLGLAALEKKDYDKAAKYLEKAKNYSKEAKEKGKEAFYYKASECLDSKNYTDAAKFFELADDFKDAKAKAKECNYQAAIAEIIEKDFDDAKDYLAGLGKYKSAQDLINVCNAEISYENDQISKAANYYAKVSKKLKINGFDVQGRRAAISAELAFAKIAGDYTAKSNNTYVKNIKKTRRYTKWRKWYLTRTADDQYLSIEYTKNDDGTFDLSITASFAYFVNYSANKANVQTDDYDVSKTLTKLKKVPSKIKLDSYTTLVYKKGVFTIVYARNQKSGSSTNQFRATVKFKRDPAT